MHGTANQSADRKPFTTVAPIWLQRAKFAAELLGSPAAVVDLGCGAMSVRSFLPAATRYVGVDHIARDADTIVVDLNTDPLPNLGISQASMLGVLEYLHDVPAMLARLHAEYDGVVLSYCHTHLLGKREKRARYWANHYTRLEFRRMLMRAGFKVVAQRRFRIGECLYRVERNVA